DPRIMRSIVGKFMRELSEQLSPRGVTIELTERGIEYLAKKGHDPMNGARPLARVIQEEVKRPLTDELLFGALANGGRVSVDMEGEKLTFACASSAAKLVSPEKTPVNKPAFPKLRISFSRVS